jgi:hypothetical protein
LDEAVREEEERETTGEKVLQRKELRAMRKTAYARLIMGSVGVVFLILAILFGDLQPTVYVPFPLIQRYVSIPGITLGFAAIACISTALRP